ncbi:FAD-dependent oxidoreductase [Sedimentibacter sp. MB31-C6]|uniref:FAD-dependent oxidoreductase n=1 Tax=Sedimentibacter sp. MB31-C6 TaxID=3109366 RepID=UPI002DDC91BB|nr:FAD-dependent oxidoreductase [Sedimentibacter sp. MB36-C1]WSI04580.1 FAD-dependent oxidoreductase [Sedimentibacter sp. MB36-C1]
MRIVIIGAVAAGTSAATEIRRNNKEAEIIVYEKDKFISYAGCGMPFFISNEVNDFSDIVPRNAEFFKEKHNIDIYTEHEVMSVNPGNKTLRVKNQLSGEIFDDSYDKLIISTGAMSVTPDLKGSDKDNVFLLRNINDMNNIRSFIEEKKPKSAVIIGSGFIGLEMCESFKYLGMDVSIIARSKIAKGIDNDMSLYIEEHLRKKGVNVYTNTKTLEINNQGVVISEGSIIKADIVLLATGIKPNVGLAKSMGIELGASGAIKVDKYMRTNLNDIYSCGDCIEMFYTINETPVYRPLGSTANKTGTIAGSNIVGKNDEFRGILGTGIFRVFDITVGMTGFSEEEAVKLGYNVSVSIDKRPNKPKYMGGKPIVIKAVSEKETGRLLGAQLIGYEGVDKRLDVLVTAITLKASAEDLMHLDLAYSPPYSIPRDPLYYTGAKLSAKK